MLVKMEDGEPPIEGTIEGSTFYLAAGRLVQRQRVSAIVTGTELVLAEVNGVVSASKAWSMLLSESQRLAWDLAAPAGVDGFDWWVWFWSIYDWIFGDMPPFDPWDGPDMDLLFDDFVFDACTPLITVTLGTTSGITDGYAWVAMGPPYVAGRVPDPREAKTIARKVPVGSAVDLTGEYLRVFGSVGGADTPFLVRARAASESSGAWSAIALLSGRTTCGVAWIFAAPTLDPIGLGETVAVDGNVDLVDGLTTAVEVTVTGPAGFSIGPPATVGNPDSFSILVTEVSAGTGTFNFNARGVSLQTGAIANAPFTLTVTP